MVCNESLLQRFTLWFESRLGVICNCFSPPCQNYTSYFQEFQHMLNVNRWQKAVRLHPETYRPTLSPRPGTAYHCLISPSSWADSWHQPWPSCHRMPPLSQWKRSQGWNRRCGSSARLSAFCPARWGPGKREKQDDYELRWKNTEQESSTVMGDFNTAFSVTDRLRRQRVKNLKSTINKLHSCEHRAAPAPRECTFWTNME